MALNHDMKLDSSVTLLNVEVGDTAPKIQIKRLVLPSGGQKFKKLQELCFT
jgi:hypothetical protein